VENVAIGIEEEKPSVSFYLRTGACPAVDQSLRCQFFISEQDGVSGNAKGLGKSSSRWQASAES
jgi:hypothetical protein